MRQSGRGKKYLGSALRIALGAGTVLGGSYILSRLKEKQVLESRIDRLEQMVEMLSATEEEKAGSEQEQEY